MSNQGLIRFSRTLTATGHVSSNTLTITAASFILPSGAVLDVVPTGSGADKVFFENDQNITADYTITSGKNAMSAGPLTIDSGVTVTIPSGSEWSIV